MSLRELNLKKAYSSDSDDILHDFYIPALGKAVEYGRLAGFFSSTSLAVAARGIVGLLANEGTVKLVVSPRLSKRDLDVLIESHEDPEKFIEEKMLKEIDNLESEFVRDHVHALGWMVANKKLEIRVATIYDEVGNPMSYEEGQERGMFHQKVGILKDSEGDIVSFSGSVNETAAGWLENIEEFKVFRSWEPFERGYIDADIAKFNKFWNGQSPRVRVVAIPDAVEKRLVEIAPDDIAKINLKKWDKKPSAGISTQIALHQHQQAAVEKWLKNDMKGIFEMATGTGKTFAALGCLERASKAYKRLVVIVACPLLHLTQQWKRETVKFGINFQQIVADSSNPSWKNHLTDALIDVSIGYKDHLIVLTTHLTFSSTSFRDIISNNTSGPSILLIADEVHGVGAEKVQQGLGQEYNLRLGLSATPRRWFDVAGTRVIYDYFGDVVYEFGLREATTTINHSTGKTYLTPYRYIPSFVSLTPEELQKYVHKTQAIVKASRKARDEDEKENILKVLRIARANIVKNAVRKYEVLKELIDKMGSDIKWTIVYCTPQPEQIEKVMQILREHDTITHRFTGEEGTEPKREYSGLSQRDFILKKFAEGEYQVLAAMKCLDQGVDVPPARSAILMASSGNPIEYIQRIGRVIRRYPGKDEATIYDILVTPSFTSLPKELRDVEWTIFEKELKRCEEIAAIAINSAGALKTIFEMKNMLMGAKR